MEKLRGIIVLVLVILFLNACDSDHSNEFYNIDRYDIEALEYFIEKYPESRHVQDAKERISEAIRDNELKELEERYGNNSLMTGTEPYAQWRGSNSNYYFNLPHSEIRVTAPTNSDVIVIVRFNNHNGEVAGHSYVRAGDSVSILLENSFSYQTFFYFGRGWNPDKEMKNGIRGGFVFDESFSKDDTSSYLENQILTYELVLKKSGNFSTSESSEGEMF